MIDIEGHNFKTYEHRILAGGRPVKQVWANGNMVYPNEGDLIKLRIFIDETFTHTDNAIDQADSIINNLAAEGTIPHTRFGPCTSSFSIKAVGALVARCNMNVYPNGFWAAVRQVERGIDRSVSSPYSSKLHGYPLSQNKPISLTCPLCGVEELSSIVIPWTSGPNVKLRYQMSSIPVCGPYVLPFRSHYLITPILYPSIDSDSGTYLIPRLYEEGWPDSHVVSYETYRIEPSVSTIIGPSEFNGRIFASPQSGNELKFYGQKSDYDAKGETVIELRSSSLSIVDNWASCCIGATYRFPVDVIKITGDAGCVNEQEEFYGHYYVDGSFAIDVPFTEVLYIGKEEDAPEWAKTVTEDDLRLN